MPHLQLITSYSQTMKAQNGQQYASVLQTRLRSHAVLVFDAFR